MRDRMSYVDFHTHERGCASYEGVEDVIVVQSLMYTIDDVHSRADYVTVGIHPMQPNVRELVDYLVHDPEGFYTKALGYLQSLGDKCCGIGECGWDKRSELSWEEQDLVMNFHHRLSLELSLPIVLHIVGGAHRLLAMLSKTSKTQTQWWYHGYRGKLALVEQLTAVGVGISYTPREQTSMDLIRKIDALPFFLESDDSTTDIRQVYALLAHRLGVDENSLKERIYHCLGAFLSK